MLLYLSPAFDNIDHDNQFYKYVLVLIGRQFN